jgi:VCBS repeat protein
MRNLAPAVLLLVALASTGPSPAQAQCGPCPALSFDRTPRGFSVVFGNLQDQVARADIDRDGDLDLIVGNFGFPFLVAVFRGSADGILSEPLTFPAEISGDAVAAADFDLDGWIDVVVTGVNQQQFAWLRGDGSGGLDLPVFRDVGTTVSSIAAGDFNGDGRPDVALIVYPGNSVQIRFGDGAGGFDSFVTLPVGPGAISLAVTDLDSNSFADLVVPNNNSNTVSVILGRPAVLFPPPRNFFAGSNPHGAVAADFDGDGRPDLAVAISQFSTESQGLSILKGNGAGEFGSPTFVNAPQGNRLLSGHFDGNETTDLVLHGQGSLARLLGDGHGGFSIAIAQNVSAPVLVAGDFNRDGVDDLVGRFGGAFAALLSSPGRLELPRNFPQVSAASRPMATGDINSDGISDIAIAGFSAQIKVLLSDGVGGLSAGTTLSLPADPGMIVLADVNSDSKIDVIATAGGALVVFLATGGGAFGPATSYEGAAGLSFTVGDLDGDSNVDLVVTRSSDNSIAVLLGTGGGAFASPVAYSVGSFPQDVRFAYFNGDADLDVAVVNSGSVSILLGDGAGAFSSISSFPISGSFSSIAVGDFDADGNQDVVVPLAGSDQAALLAGDGLGGLGSPQPFPVGMSYAEQLVSADFNSDGRPDVAVSGNDVLAVITRGVGSFDPPVLYSALAGAIRCRPGEFNGDGRADLACGSSSVVSLMLNTNCLPRHFSVGTDPSACNVSDTLFSTQPVVRVEDDGGNVTCGSGAVTASLLPGGDPAAVLNGTTFSNTFSGSVSYTDLSVTGSGPAHRILFQHDGVGGAYSRPFSTGLSPISAPAAVCASTAGHAAAVLHAGPGLYYAWEIVNGVITAGQGTRRIVFTSGPSGPVTLRVRLVGGPPCVIEAETQVAITAGPCAPSHGYFTLDPCRLLDTRGLPAAMSGPPLSSGAIRTFPAAGLCGIPATARSVSVNLTVIQPAGDGYVTVFPGGTPIPFTSTINFRSGAVRANNAILSLGAAGDYAVFCALSSPGMSEFVLDVTGYFQ